MGGKTGECQQRGKINTPARRGQMGEKGDWSRRCGKKSVLRKNWTGRRPEQSKKRKITQSAVERASEKHIRTPGFRQTTSAAEKRKIDLEEGRGVWGWKCRQGRRDGKGNPLHEGRGGDHHAINRIVSVEQGNRGVSKTRRLVSGSDLLQEGVLHG